MILQALKFFHKLKDFAPANDKKHFDVVEQALEEVEQYRALGTVEELKEAMEKQIPKKPIRKHQNTIKDYYDCPTCGARWTFGRPPKFCNNCGQRIALD